MIIYLDFVKVELFIKDISVEMMILYDAERIMIICLDFVIVELILWFNVSLNKKRV